MYYLASIFVAVGAYFLLSYLKWRRESWIYLKKVPGEMKLPIIGTAYRYIGLPREEILSSVAKMLKKYKGISLAWMGAVPQINITKPEYLETVLNSSVHINKGLIYKGLYPWLGTGLLTSGGLKWQKHRKLITPTFHFKILENFMEIFVEKTEVLLRILDSKADGEIFNIYTCITHCTLDVICETAMGVQVNAMSNDDNPYIKAIYDITRILAWKFRKSYIPDFIFYRMKIGREFKADVEILHAFTKKVIAERKELLKSKAQSKIEISDEDLAIGKKKRTSFLDLLLEASEEGRILTDTDIREEVDTFMFEGHDTTTNAMCWTLFLLGNYPEIQEKAYEEIRNILQGKSTPTTLTELNDLKYLECIIKEAMRLYPVVAVIGRKFLQEVTIGDYVIPPNVDAGLHIHAVHKDPDHFPNPNKFDPDRFLPENTKGRHPYAYIPFSAGPRNCIGQKFAMYEEKTILSSIINRYKFTSIDNEETVKMTIDVVLRPLGGVQIKMQKR